jgi:hypothetical protein
MGWILFLQIVLLVALTIVFIQIAVESIIKAKVAAISYHDYLRYTHYKDLKE